MARRRLSNSAAARRKRAFKPFVAPTRPPPGSYDPSLDAQLRGSERGLGDLTQDTERDNARSLNDYNLSANDIREAKARSLADILRGRTEGREDYTRTVQGLDQGYSRLASSQAEAGNAAGLAGGFAQQAAEKRAANYTTDRAPVDTGYQRFTGESAQAETRLNENTEDALGKLTLGYQRGNEDRLQALTRGTREQGFFNSDIGDARFYSARGSGYVPPTMDDDERNKSGLAYKILGPNQYLTTGGKIINHAELARRHKIYRQRAKKNPSIIPPKPLY